MLASSAIVFCVGCSASFRGSAKGSVDAQGARGDAEGGAVVDLNAEGEVQPLAVGEIRYDGGERLDYGGEIHFEYDKAYLRDDEETSKVLQSFEKFLEEHPEVNLRVEGHTDSRGSDDYNQRLSDRRAASVRKWLLAQGVAEERLESVGKGESAPRVQEPEECDDKKPEDTTPCEEAWQANRRVEFHVTKGAETIEVAEAESPDATPTAEPAAAPPKKAASEEKCPLLVGVRGEALGPNALVGAAVLIEPLCWLELSLGLSYRHTLEDAEGEAANLAPPPILVEGSAGARWINVPLRGRAWIGQTHAFLVDLGVAWSHLKISGSTGNPPLGDFEYEQTGTAFFGSGGIGYGYRQPVGFRLGILVGVVGFSGSKDDPDISAPGWDGVTAATLGDVMDQETDDVWDAGPYGELSIGWTFR